MLVIFYCFDKTPRQIIFKKFNWSYNFRGLESMTVEERNTDRNSRECIFHTTNRRQKPYWEGGKYFEISKSTPIDTSPQKRPCSLNFSKQFHQLGPKYSNIWVYGNRSHSNDCTRQIKFRLNFCPLVYLNILSILHWDIIQMSNIKNIMSWCLIREGLEIWHLNKLNSWWLTHTPRFNLPKQEYGL